MQIEREQRPSVEAVFVTAFIWLGPERSITYRDLSPHDRICVYLDMSTSDNTEYRVISLPLLIACALCLSRQHMVATIEYCNQLFDAQS